MTASKNHGTGRMSIIISRIFACQKGLSSQLLSDFRPAVYAYLVILTLSSASYVLTSTGIISAADWGASRSQPVGILTSLFIHSDAAHFSGNMVLILFFTALFILVNMPYCRKERRQRGIYYVFMAFGAAVVTNTLFVLLTPETTFGSSAIGFAALGIAFGFATAHLVNELAIRIDRIRGKGTEGQGLSRKWIAANLMVFIPVFFSIVTQPEEFLGVREGVNYFGHGVAFLIALFVTVPYGIRAPSGYDEGEAGE